MDAIQYIELVRARGGVEALRQMPNVRLFGDKDDIGALMTELSQNAPGHLIWTHIPPGAPCRDDPFGVFGVIGVNVFPDPNLELIIGSLHYVDADGETHFSDFDWLHIGGNGNVAWGRNGQEFRGHRVVSIKMLDGE